MIIFYKKSTGDIVGTIEGRVHNDVHLNMWIGDKSEVDRVIFEWKLVKIDNQDTWQIECSKEMFEILTGIEDGKYKVSNFKVDLASKELAPKLVAY